jgi:probable HAF family extracellular repeat protein
MTAPTSTHAPALCGGHAARPRNQRGSQMFARTNSITRALAVVGAALAVTVAGGSPASADPPPAAAGTTSHGFVATRGALTPIDHPDATTIPAAPGGQAGTATGGINDRGQILGAYEGADRVVRHFVRDKKGRYTALEEPSDGPDGQASDEYVDINNRGEIVGFYNDEQGSTTTGFLRTRKGRFVDIDVPGSQVTGPLKVNDRRQVVGIYVDADEQPNPDGTAPPGAVHGFLWDAGDFETIDVSGAAATLPTGINDRGHIVGSYIDPGGAYHGFVRDRSGHVTTLPEAPNSDPTAGGTQPTSINDRGQIVGLAYDARGGSRAFLYERGQFRLFDGTSDAVYTRALDLNNRGQIVGDYGTRPTGKRDAGARGGARVQPADPSPELPAGLEMWRETRREHTAPPPRSSPSRSPRSP